MTLLTQQVRQFIEAHRLLLPDQTALLAVSGGADSTALALLFKELGYSFVIAHCNFGLRGEEADGDEAFVRQLADHLAVPCHTIRFETDKFAQQQNLSIQVAARKLRYDWFAQLMKTYHYSPLVTAHHANDQTETLLFTLLRGKSFNVLEGIPLKGLAVRPLLAATRLQILAYLEEKGQDYRNDSSNDETYYIRNFIRKKVAPLLYEINPSLENQLAERLELYQAQQVYVNERMKQIETEIATFYAEKRFELCKEVYHRLTETEQRLFLHYFLPRWGFVYAHFSEVRRLFQEGLSGKKVKINGFVVTRTRKGLFFDGEPATHLTPISFPAITALPNDISFHRSRLFFEWTCEKPSAFEKDVYYFDADKIRFPLTLRVWQAGDEMQPLGMKGSKKIKNILTDIKFPTEDKPRAWLLADTEKIVFLQNFRVSSSVAIEEKTKSFLILRIENKNITELPKD